MTAHIYMQKVSVVHPNPAIAKLRYLRRQFVHLLQREPGQPDIGSEAPGLLAVGNAAYLLVVVRAAVPGVDDHGHAGEGAQCLQALDQVRVQLQPATTATFKFFARKVLTQIAHSNGTPTEKLFCKLRLAKSEYSGKVANHHAACAPSQR